MVFKGEECCKNLVVQATISGSTLIFSGSMDSELDTFGNPSWTSDEDITDFWGQTKPWSIYYHQSVAESRMYSNMHFAPYS